MKSIIAILLSCIAVVSFGGDFDLYIKVKNDIVQKKNVSYFTYGWTDDQWIEYVDQVCATNVVDGSAYNVYMPNVVWILKAVANKKFNEQEKKAFFREWDSKLLASNIGVSEDASYWAFPLITTKFFEDNPKWVFDHPVAHALWLRYPDVARDNRPVEARINLFVENFANGYMQQYKISRSIKTLASDTTIPVKKYLRQHGKTFVTGDDGTNPVQEIIEPLIDAFQEPMCAGVKEFVQQYMPDYQWIDVNMMSTNDVEKLKDEVFFGEKPLNNKNAVRLQFGLGIDAYNAFIEEYNNDAK